MVCCGKEWMMGKIFTAHIMIPVFVVQGKSIRNAADGSEPVTKV